MIRRAKLSGFVVLITVVNLIMILAVVGPARSTAGQNPPCIPGDVNGDFTVDLSDPLYLLNFLFTQGSDPVACPGSIEVIVTNTPDVNVVRMRPHPGDVVNLNGVANPTVVGDIQTIFEVPEGQWLIVTNVRSEKTDDRGYELIEDANGIISLKYHSSFLEGFFLHQDTAGGYVTPYQSSIGLVFAPQSTVAFRKVSGNNGGQIAYHLTGYFVDIE